MERAILFFDIDGTVLSEVTKEVPQSAIEAMEKARAEGHLLFINTGRTICSIPTEVRKFQFDGYLCGCGTYLTEHDEVLLKSSIEKQRGIELSLESERFEYDKLFVYVDDKSDFDSFREYLGDDMEVLDRGGKAYEVIQKGFSKATACQFIMERYDMDASHAYVFGDSSNDLAMFEYAEHAIAMGRHDSVLDSYAEFVTKTVENDGIAYAMKHYGLI